MPTIREMLRAFIGPLATMRAYWFLKRRPVFRAEAMRSFPRPALDFAWPSPPFKRLRKVPMAVLIAGLLVILVPFSSFIMQLIVVGVLLVPAAFMFLVALPFVPWLWRIPTVLSAALPVAREIEKRRWLILRSTPYSTREIVEALHAAGTYRVISLWMYVTGVRLALAGLLTLPLLGAILQGVLLFALELSRSISAGQVAQPRLMLIDWMAYALSIGYLLIEPFLDMTIDGAVGILASTLSRSQLSAMLNGLVLRVGLWLVQMLGVLLMLPLVEHLLTPLQITSVPALVILGPAYGLLLGFSSALTAVTIIAVVVLRILALHGLMRLAVWCAVRVEEG